MVNAGVTVFSGKDANDDKPLPILIALKVPINNLTARPDLSYQHAGDTFDQWLLLQSALLPEIVSLLPVEIKRLRLCTVLLTWSN